MSATYCCWPTFRMCRDVGPQDIPQQSVDLKTSTVEGTDNEVWDVCTSLPSLNVQRATGSQHPSSSAHSSGLRPNPLFEPASAPPFARRSSPSCTMTPSYVTGDSAQLQSRLGRSPSVRGDRPHSLRRSSLPVDLPSGHSGSASDVVLSVQAFAEEDRSTYGQPARRHTLGGRLLLPSKSCTARSSMSGMLRCKLGPRLAASRSVQLLLRNEQSTPKSRPINIRSSRVSPMPAASASSPLNSPVRTASTGFPSSLDSSLGRRMDTWQKAEHRHSAPSDDEPYGDSGPVFRSSSPVHGNAAFKHMACSPDMAPMLADKAITLGPQLSDSRNAQKLFNKRSVSPKKHDSAQSWQFSLSHHVSRGVRSTSSNAVYPAGLPRLSPRSRTHAVQSLSGPLFPNRSSKNKLQSTYPGGRKTVDRDPL